MQAIAGEWQKFIGTIWAALLSNHSFDPFGTVIEIGPGFTDKIGCGLSELGFRGKLYIIEPNKAALSWVTVRYEYLLPQAEIIGINHSISEGQYHTPKNVQAVLMNHILDDMVLNEGLTHPERQAIFGQMRPGLPLLNETKHRWQYLTADPKLLSDIQERVIKNLCKFIRQCDARIVGISQYKSWILSQNELENANEVGSQVLRHISMQLGNVSSVDREILARYGQKPEEWLLVENKMESGTLPIRRTSIQQKEGIQI